MRSASKPTDSPSRAHIVFNGLFSAAVFAALALYAFDAVHYGISFTDEGMKLSVPWRYSVGDLPFRNEILTVGRSHGILLWPVFELFPDITVLQLRYGSAGLQLASMLSFFALLSRFAPSFLVSAATTSSAFMSLVGLWTPGYNTLGVHFVLLAISLWLNACVSRSSKGQVLLAIVAGMCLALASIAYLTFAAVLLVPVGVLASHLLKRTLPSPIAVATGTLLASVAVAFAAMAGVLWTTDLLSDWFVALDLLRDAPQYSPPLASKLTEFSQDLARMVPQIAGVAAVLALAGLALRVPLTGIWQRGVLAIPLAVGGLLAVVAQQPLGIRADYHFSFSVMTAALGMTIVNLLWEFLASQRLADDFSGSGTRTASWRFVQWIAVGMVLLVCFLHAITSSNGFFNFRHAIGPVFTVGVVGLYRSSFSVRPSGTASFLQRALPVASLLAVCMTYAVFHLPERARMSYKELPRAALTATFTHPLLAGIHSSPRRVATLEPLLRFLDARTERGEYLLEYYGSPILYYLTRTRPATPIIWMNSRTPQKHVEYVLQTMLRERTLPRYVVVTPHPSSPRDAIDVYIARNYERIRSFGGLEVWKRREP